MFNITGNELLDLAIVESDAKRQKLEKLFMQHLRLNEDPNIIQNEVYKEAGFTPKELLDEDVRLLKLHVEEMVRHYGCW